MNLYIGYFMKYEIINNLTLKVHCLCTSHLYPRPHLRGKPGNSRAKVQGNYFLVVPAVLGNRRGF